MTPAEMSRYSVALLLLLSSCNPNQICTGDTDIAAEAKRRACSVDEVARVEMLYAVCVDGQGYISSACFDRAIVAACHVDQSIQQVKP